MKKPRWKRRLKIASVVLVLLAYGLGQLYMRIDKLGTDLNMYAADIAIGEAPKTNHYKEIYTGGRKPIKMCDAFSGKPTPSWWCTALGRDGDWRGCNLWRFERCTAYEASAYMLSRPDLLGPMLASLKNPCLYLPSPEEVQALPVKRKPTHLSNAYVYQGCEDGYGRFPERLILNFVNDSGKVVARYDIEPE